MMVVPAVGRPTQWMYPATDVFTHFSANGVMYTCLVNNNDNINNNNNNNTLLIS